MGKASLGLWLWGLMVGTGLVAAGPSECAAQGPFAMPRNQYPSATARKPGVGESVASSVKQGLDRLAQIVTPKPRVEAADDPVSLATKAKAGVELHLAVARLYEESGKPSEAAKHYRKALQDAPDNVGALLGYAHLKDRLGEPEEARRLYLQAVTAHPKDASVHNNLALFFAGRGMLDEAGSEFARAVQLQPKNPKYRNNFARLLVRMGRPREALAHLRAAHAEAIAYYNLGYLLQEQGQLQAAAQQYAFALQADPSLLPARRGLQRIQSPSTQPQAPGDPADQATRVNDRSTQQSGRPQPPRLENPFDAGPPPSPRQLTPIWKPWPQGSQGGENRAKGSQAEEVAPLPPDGPRLMRLPPTSGGPPPAPKPAPLPPRSSDREPIPAAPLPPQTENGPALQPLPRVD